MDTLLLWGVNGRVATHCLVFALPLRFPLYQFGGCFLSCSLRALYLRYQKVECYISFDSDKTTSIQ
jgi:hypothetical protein